MLDQNLLAAPAALLNEALLLILIPLQGSLHLRCQLSLLPRLSFLHRMDTFHQKLLYGVAEY